MNNPLFRYTKVEASEEETSVVSSNKPHDSNSLANITSSKKKINTTAKHNSEAKTFAFEKAKSLNKASVGKNTFRASRNVFEDPSSGVKQVLNPRTGEYEKLGENDDHPALWNRIETSGFLLKVLAALHNPLHAWSILQSDRSEIIESYAGSGATTLHPMEVGRRILGDLQEFIMAGGWTVGRLAFFGGVWGALRGLAFIITPSSLFHVVSPIATLTKLYLTLFCIVIMTVESDGETISADFKSFIFKHCAALKFMLARGLFYCYVGVTCILGGRLTKRRVFGWFFVGVGLLNVLLHVMTMNYIKDLSEVFVDDSDLVASFHQHAKGKGWLDRSELIALLAERGMLRSHQEVEALFDLVDADNSGCISLVELRAGLGQLETPKGQSASKVSSDMKGTAPASGPSVVEDGRGGGFLKRGGLSTKHVDVVHHRSLDEALRKQAARVNDNGSAPPEGDAASDGYNDEEKGNHEEEGGLLKRLNFFSSPQSRVLAPNRSGNTPLVSSQQQRLADAVASHASDPGSGDLRQAFIPGSLRFLDGCVPCAARALPDKQHVDVAANAAKDVVAELTRMHRDAPDGIHFFAFSSGVLLCIAATENAISGAMSRRSLLHVFFAGIIFLSGLLIIALEHQGGGVVFSPRATAFVTQNFLFLRFITGRGCFIVYIGSVQAAIHWRKWASRFVGLFVVAVGFSYIWTGHCVSRRLGQLQVQLQSDAIIRKKFEAAVRASGSKPADGSTFVIDSDGDGRLAVGELRSMMEELGTRMSTAEAELCLLRMGSVGEDGKIGMGDFRDFMQRRIEPP